MTTPIERAAEAGARAARGVTAHVKERDEELARAVFKSIDREGLAGEIHARFNECRGRQGVSPQLLADAIIAYLTGEESK